MALSIAPKELAQLSIFTEYMTLGPENRGRRRELLPPQKTEMTKSHVIFSPPETNQH